MKAYCVQIWRMHFSPWLYHNHIISKVQKSAIKHINFVLHTHNNLTFTEDTMWKAWRLLQEPAPIFCLTQMLHNHHHVPDDGKLHLTELWKVSGVNLQSWKGEDKTFKQILLHPILYRRNWPRTAVLLHLHFSDNSVSLQNVHESFPHIRETQPSSAVSSNLICKDKVT